MVKITCHKCGKQWDYKGSALFATCPNCLSKVKVDEPSTMVEDLSDIIVQVANLEREGKIIDEKVVELIEELKKKVIEEK